MKENKTEILSAYNAMTGQSRHIIVFNGSPVMESWGAIGDESAYAMAAYVAKLLKTYQPTEANE